MKLSLTIKILAFNIVLCAGINRDEFTEELYVKALPTGHMYNHFQFTTKWDIDTQDKKSYQHFRLVPKSLGEIISKFDVQELHLSLTQGLWKHKQWGYSIDSAPPGVQLWVWFRDGIKNVDAVWKDLTNALSGQFCASLNFIDETNTVNSKWSFRPTGIHRGELNNSLLRYAALPRENVCTENLTPWKKLLPCGSVEGLSTLLNAGQLFNAHYNSLSVRIRPVCRTDDCSSTSLELSQSVSVVLEPSQFKKRKQNWSLYRSFGTKLFSTCSLAKNTHIIVDTSSNETGNVFRLDPPPSEVIVFGRRNLAVYNVGRFLTEKPTFNVEAVYDDDIPSAKIPAPNLYSHRFIAGLGQEIGEIRCQIYNKETENVTVAYQEVIPWFIRVYLSKLNIRSQPRDGRTDRTLQIKPLKKHYQPSKDRQSPAHIEIIFQLPPLSFTEISIEFTRGFLKWTEHPPDANHGFYINAAVISAVLHSPSNYTAVPITSSSLYEGFRSPVEENNLFLRLYTETLLVSLPTPDFSMPYNVICLACTVVALAFGPLHNITTRRLTAVDPDDKQGFVHRIKSFFSKSKRQEKATKED